MKTTFGLLVCCFFLANASVFGADWQEGLSKSSVGRFGFNPDLVSNEGLLSANINTDKLQTIIGNKPWMVRFSVANDDLVTITNWKFKTDPEGVGQQEGWYKPQFNDAGWKNISGLQFWEQQGITDPAIPKVIPYPGMPEDWQEPYNGFGWYRTTFNLKGPLPKTLFLHITRADDFDWAYLNGTLIGKTGSEVGNSYLISKDYPVPAGLLKEGENTLVVCVFDVHGPGGLSGPVIITKEQKKSTVTKIENLNWMAEKVNTGKGYSLSWSLATTGVLLETEKPSVSFNPSEPFDYVCYQAENGTQVVPVKGETSIPPAALTANWLLFFNRPRTPETPVVPFLVVLQKRPSALSCYTLSKISQVELTFEAGAGKVVFGLPFGKRLWDPASVQGWSKGLPVDVLDTVRFWSRAYLAFPDACREEFKVEGDRVLIKDIFSHILIADAWGTKPLLYAPIPTLLSTMRKTTYPVKVEDKLTYLGCDALHGPLEAVVNSNTVTYSLPATPIDMMYCPADQKEEAINNIFDQYAKMYGTKYTKMVRDMLSSPAAKIGSIRSYDTMLAQMPLSYPWCTPEGKTLWQERFTVVDQAYFDRGCWRRFIEPTTGRSFIEAHMMGLKKIFGEDKTLDGALIPKEILGVNVGQDGDVNSAVGIWLASIWSCAAIGGDWQPVRDNWSFIKEIFSYDTLINDWDYMGSSCQSKGSWGEGADMVWDGYSGYSPLRQMARVVGDEGTYNLVTYMQAKLSIPLFVRFMGYRDYLLKLKVPLIEDEAATMIGEDDYPIWQTFRTSNFGMRKGSGLYGDTLLRPVSPVPWEWKAFWELCEPSYVSGYLAWFKRWNGQDWYKWENSQIEHYAEWGVRYNSDHNMHLWSSTWRNTDYSALMFIHMLLGTLPETLRQWTDAGFYTNQNQSSGYDEPRNENGNEPKLYERHSFEYAPVIYAKNPCWIASWEPAVITEASYDSTTGKTTLKIDNPVKNLPLKFFCKEMPAEILINGKLLEKKSWQTAGKYLTISLPEKAGLEIALNFKQ